MLPLRDLKKSAEENRLLVIKQLEKRHQRARFQDALFLIMCTLVGLTLLVMTSCEASAQSFFPHKTHSSFNDAGRTIKVKTIGQRIRTKVQYARKRHNSERFAFRNMRQRSRAGQI